MAKSECNKQARSIRSTGIGLVEGCGDEDGVGRRQLGRAAKPQQSKVLSGGWLVSRSLFVSMDLSPEVRLANGQINPSWPLLAGLRAASSVYKTRDWQAFYVAPSSDSRVVGSGVCPSLKRPRRRLGAWPEEARNISRRLLTAPMRRLALLPLDPGGQDSSRSSVLCCLLNFKAIYRHRVACVVAVGSCSKPALWLRRLTRCSSAHATPLRVTGRAAAS